MLPRNQYHHFNDVGQFSGVGGGIFAVGVFVGVSFPGGGVQFS